jgi:hypothetical protein
VSEAGDRTDHEYHQKKKPLRTHARGPDEAHQRQSSAARPPTTVLDLTISLPGRTGPLMGKLLGVGKSLIRTRSRPASYMAPSGATVNSRGLLALGAFNHGSIVGSIGPATLEDSIWICPIDDRCKLNSSRASPFVDPTFSDAVRLFFYAPSLAVSWRRNPMDVMRASLSVRVAIRLKSPNPHTTERLDTAILAIEVREMDYPFPGRDPYLEHPVL